MPAIVPAIATELANGARDVLRQGAAVLTGNQGNYIKDGEPGSIYGKIQQETARQACRRYGDDPSIYSGAASVLAENACRPYLDDIGYGPGPTIKLPFRGGQCQQNYTVSITTTAFPFSDCSNFGPGTSVNGYTGPIRGLRFGVVNPSGELCTPGRNIAYLQHGPPGNESVVGGGGFGVTANINSVTPELGLPDNCGNPLPIIEPPSPNPNPEPPGPRPFSPSPDIDIDIDVTVNPDLTIDVDFGTGPISIDPFGGGGGGGGGTGGPGSPGNPSDTGQGGGADGEAPPGQILTGLRVNFIEPPIGGNEYAPGVYRGVCYIYMGTADGLDHDPAGAMLKDGQFVYAEKDYLTRWSITANMGYNLRVTPYYRPAEAED